MHSGCEQVMTLLSSETSWLGSWNHKVMSWGFDWCTRYHMPDTSPRIQDQDQFVFHWSHSCWANCSDQIAAWKSNKSSRSLIIGSPSCTARARTSGPRVKQGSSQHQHWATAHCDTSCSTFGHWCSSDILGNIKDLWSVLLWVVYIGGGNSYFQVFKLRISLIQWTSFFSSQSQFCISLSLLAPSSASMIPFHWSTAPQCNVCTPQTE